MTVWPSIHPRSLRARLLLWVGVIIAVTLLAFSGIVYATLDRSLSGQIDRSLVARAEQVNGTIELELSGPRMRRRGGVNVPPPDTFASADTFVQVATLDGHVLRTPFDASEATLPLSARALVRIGAGDPVFETVRSRGERVRLYSAPLEMNGQVVGVVQVGRSLGFADRALSHLRLLAGLGLLVALALAMFGVSVMTSTTLRPLERLIRTAESIGSSRDLSQRVDPPGVDDEVGRLAVTFNSMFSQLQTSDAQLRESLESQRRFVADASHEMRTPLTAIRGNAGMLRQVQMAPEDRAEAIDEIHREAERMSRLVGDLLALARADAGRELRREPLDLAGLVQEVAIQAARLADEREISTAVRGSFTVVGDPDALRQLVLILLDNAVKYTPQGGSITVTLLGRGDDVRLSVADTGIGMGPEHLAHIFDRFYRADPARSEGGTGLGLAIARWIAEQHGGRIELESFPGRGSTFTVLLPAQAPDTGHSEAALKQSAESLSDAAAHRA